MSRINILHFTNEDQYRRARFVSIHDADVIVVNGILVKNRFGPQDIPYCGHFGICPNCNEEIKQRELLTSTYIGCMC